ncbi:hypothetical protein ERO13_A09G141866v2 [Gossypium hirsutum]|nr:hypothetical protein ERO13_A09G141866v2 [Gossypium hirsutum]
MEEWAERVVMSMGFGWQANQKGRGSSDAIWAASYGSRWRSRGLVNQERMFDVFALPVIYIYIRKGILYHFKQCKISYFIVKCKPDREDHAC